MTQSPVSSGPLKSRTLTIIEYILFLVCLGALALRITYTEAPSANALSLPVNIFDNIYSLTISGVLIFSFVFWLAWNLRRPEFTYRVTGIESGLLLFFIACIISTSAASDKRLAITTIVILSAPIFAAIFFVQILDSPAKVRLVLAVIVAFGIVAAYQSAEQFFITNQMTIEQYQKSPRSVLEPLGIEPGTLQHFLFEHRLYAKTIRGFFTTSNSLGSFLLMALFAGFALLLPCQSRRKSQNISTRHIIAPALATTVIALVLILTKSKGAILSALFAVSLFIIAFRFRNWFTANRKILLFVFILLFAAGSCLITWYGLRHGRLPGGNSMLVRWQYWYASVKMVADHPLTGVGPGNFPLFYTHYKPAPAPESVADPHNFILSLLTQYGPLGLLGFLLIILRPIYRALSPNLASLPNNIRTSGKTFTTALLLGIPAILLLVRPLLIPTSPTEDFGLIAYTILTMYIAPAAVFIIAFWLLTNSLTARNTIYDIRYTNLVDAALLCALLGVLLHNLIDFAIFEPGVLTTFWIFLGCLIATDINRRNISQFTYTAVPYTKTIVPIVVLLLFVLYIAHIWWPVYNSTMKTYHAQQVITAGRFDQADILLDEAAKVDSLSAVAVNFNGRLCLQLYHDSAQVGFLEKAGTCFHNAIKRNPADYKAYEKLSTVYTLLGRPEQAFEWGLKATRLYSGCDRLWLNLAKITEQLSKPTLALQYYKKAVEIEDEYRRQFRTMYPQIENIVSRLGEQNYQFAKQRIKELSGN
jgi:O-antigen ligase/tetratricopeptide (TPR) repeat protein